MFGAQGARRGSVPSWSGLASWRSVEDRVLLQCDESLAPVRIDWSGGNDHVRTRNLLGRWTPAYRAEILQVESQIARLLTQSFQPAHTAPNPVRIGPFTFRPDVGRLRSFRAHIPTQVQILSPRPKKSND